MASSEEHERIKQQLNHELIGNLGAWHKQEFSPRGVRRPAWFQDVSMDDVDQMARMLTPGRRAR